jgi:hypothetical protein
MKRMASSMGPRVSPTLRDPTGRFVGPMVRSDPLSLDTFMPFGVRTTGMTTVSEVSRGNKEINVTRHMIIPDNTPPRDCVSVGEHVFERIDRSRTGRGSKSILPYSDGSLIYGLAALNHYLSSEAGRREFPAEDVKSDVGPGVQRAASAPWTVFKYIGVASGNPSSQYAEYGQAQVPLTIGGVARCAHIWLYSPDSAAKIIQKSTFLTRLYFEWRQVSMKPSDATAKLQKMGVLSSLRRNAPPGERKEAIDAVSRGVQNIGRRKVVCWQIVPVMRAPGISHPSVEAKVSIYVGRVMGCSKVDPDMLQFGYGHAQVAAGLSPFVSEPIAEARRGLELLPQIDILCRE